MARLRIAALAAALAIVLPAPARAYSVLAHEAIVDALWDGGIHPLLRHRFPRATILGGDAAFEQVVATVIGCVEQPARGLDLPLDVRGTAFQQRVWQALREIPAGSTVSYRDIAARIGAPNAARAVAQACGANALAVAIPCHRVVRTDGSLSGYRWGIERKRTLLTREGAA